MRESHPLQIGDNVYWISAAAAARCARDTGKGTMMWSRARFPGGMRVMPGTALFKQTKVAALDVAAELEELVHTCFLQASGLALAGGILSASMLFLL